MKSLSKPIYDRLARLSRKKLDKMEMEHNVHFEAFSNPRATKVDEIQSLERKLEKLRSRAIKEKSQSVAKAMGTAVEMRRVRTDLLIARSVLSVLHQPVPSQVDDDALSRYQGGVSMTHPEFHN